MPKSIPRATQLEILRAGDPSVLSQHQKYGDAIMLAINILCGTQQCESLIASEHLLRQGT